MIAWPTRDMSRQNLWFVSSHPSRSQASKDNGACIVVWLRVAASDGVLVCDAGCVSRGSPHLTGSLRLNGLARISRIPDEIFTRGEPQSGSDDVGFLPRSAHLIGSRVPGQTGLVTTPQPT